MKTVNIGGDRLGSGNKMNVALRNYERSTHDLSYVWRSSMAPGTLLPFLKQVALPGDTFDINLDGMVKTIPTLGPLFGSFKFQLDIFQIPLRLYVKELHNNKLGIGMNMANVALPYVELTAPNPTFSNNTDIDLSNFQINQSSLLAYLGIRSLGYDPDTTNQTVTRSINAIPLIAYYDIYKNYYANKQEELGYIIEGYIEQIQPWSSITIKPQNTDILNIEYSDHIPLIDIGHIELKSDINIPIEHRSKALDGIKLPVIQPDESSEQMSLTTLYNTFNWIDDKTCIVSGLKQEYHSNYEFHDKAYQGKIPGAPGIKLGNFVLQTIDILRENLLNDYYKNVSGHNLISRATAYNIQLKKNVASFSQTGLAIKTYQSDIFNNWISTEWLDGENGINAITAVDTSEGYFTIDQLNLSKKVYDMLNRIAVSGGTYQDWLEVSYDIEPYFKAETPIYCGGLSKEIIFTEVTSTAEDPDNPLGTLAGKGTFSDKHKGGYVVVKVDEPSYIIGIASITPRIDYSQGNDWDISLNNMGQLHVPALDGIGFQDLLTEQMHGVTWNAETGTSPAVGKQPAWINYMSNFNRVYGTFAEPENQMFMVLNRRYTTEIVDKGFNKSEIVIKDLTTYIDPTKYNYAFADTALDAQNFWVQIGVGIEARRKMSAKQIPNL